MAKWKIKDMAKIEQITRAREQTALAALATAASERKKAAEAVAELLATSYEARSAAEAEVVAKWLVWKQSELIARNTQLAAAEAKFQTTLRKSGRQIAEHAVLSELLETARNSDKKLREARACALTSPDAQSL